MRRVLTYPPTGVLLLVLLAGWALFSTPSAPEAASGAAACLVLASGLVVGVMLGRVDPAIPGLAVLAGAVVALGSGWPESMSGEPLAPPLGYMNANGALLLCGAAGAVVATRRRGLPFRLAASGVATLAAAACMVNGAQASAAAAALLAVWSPIRHLGRSSAWAAMGALLISLPGVLATAWGAGLLPRPGFVVATLSEERFQLWGEGVDMAVQSPVSGVGPGRFDEVSRISDADLAWAHSYWLQAAAELGLVGLTGLVLVLAWAVAALGRHSVLLAILLLPASVDYVLHFGAVLVALSLVVGGSIGSGSGKPWLTPPSP